MALQRLLLFGDQTVEKLPSIQNLVRVSKTSPSLRRFLREATDVIQTEVTKLSPDERKAFFAFDTLLSLAEENAKEEAPNEIVATTLMCIARLGELILLVTSSVWPAYVADFLLVMSKMILLSWDLWALRCTC